jgi:peptidoglycan/LPS O-acetylase OafA/YrhL
LPAGESAPRRLAGVTATTERASHAVGTSVQRYPTLDLLRVVAISLTMATHMPSLMQRIRFLRVFSHGTWLGVDLFMLISGWLLGGQLLRDVLRDAFSPVRFYVKRWMRTLPPYYAMLVVLYVAGDTLLAQRMTLRTAFTHAFFLQEYVRPNLYGVSWSLCVEEHFYLLLPAVVWFVARRARLTTMVGLVLALEGASMALRFAAYRPGDDVPYLSHLRCDGLFLGLLLAWTELHRPASWGRLASAAKWAGPIGIVGTLGVMASTWRGPSLWMYGVVPTLGTWTVAMIFLGCVHERSSWSRVRFPGLRVAGDLTYSLYLVHSVIPRSWLGLHLEATGCGVLWRLTLVVALSALLHLAVERPSLRLRALVLERWPSRRLGA